MKKIRLGQIGIGHNHAEAKMYAARKFPELFEIIGWAEENERWVEKRGNNSEYKDIPRLSVDEIIEKSDVSFPSGEEKAKLIYSQSDFMMNNLY